jgi:hypothetical protein
MRIAPFTAALLLVLPNAVVADDATALVDKAVQATAGSDLRLNRLSNLVRVEQGTLNFLTGPTPVKRKVYLSPPDRLKYDATIDRGGQQESLVLTLNGVAGWKKEGSAIKDASAAEYDIFQDEAYAAWLMTLLPVRQRGATVKSIPAVTIKGKPAPGVLLSRPGRSDARLYFAENGLLVQFKLKVREGGVEVERTYDLDGYKEFEGIKLPTKISAVQGGRKIEEWTVESYRTPDRFDDNVFAKPK